MPEKITLRPATIHDLETLKHWDTQPHVNDSDPNHDWNWDVELQKDEPWREQLIAELDDRLLDLFKSLILKQKNHTTGAMLQKT